MDQKTLIALNKSIVKYIDIASGRKSPTLGPDECELCNLFFDKRWCSGCPVAENGGAAGCEGTPYDTYGLAVNLRKPYHKHAAEEAEFLIQLLPVEHADVWRN